ncbi:MAG: amidohydrolase family protein [Terriglobia bacterium]
MRVDAHTHVWKAVPNYSPANITTVSPACDVPMELLLEYMDEHDVRRAVLVQPIFPGTDNQYVADCARTFPDRFCAVCVVDPRSQEFGTQLRYWVEERGCRGLRLRPRIQGEEAPFHEASFVNQWEQIASLKLVVNVLIGSSQLGLLPRWLERFPEVPVIIDHLGHPQVEAGVQGEEFQALLQMSRFPNLHLKTSGYYYFSRERFPFSDCWDLFRALYDGWGPERLIWGSDFPHVLLKVGYRRALLFHERFYKFLSPRDLNFMMAQNALRLYWKNQGVES